MPVSMLVTVTVTSGTTAPVESVTIPRKSPELVAWPPAMPSESEQAAAKVSALIAEFLFILPPEGLSVLIWNVVLLGLTFVLVLSGKQPNFTSVVERLSSDEVNRQRFPPETHCD